MTSQNNHGSFIALGLRLIRDESGAEVVEAALVIGLIAILCVAAMKGVSVTLADRWNNILNLIAPGDSA